MRRRGRGGWGKSKKVQLEGNWVEGGGGDEKNIRRNNKEETTKKEKRN